MNGPAPMDSLLRSRRALIGRIHAGAVGIPTLVGSGVTPGNVRDFAAAAGIIVGSSVKRDGLWSNPLDPARVQAMARAFDALPARS